MNDIVKLNRCFVLVHQDFYREGTYGVFATFEEAVAAAKHVMSRPGGYKPDSVDIRAFNIGTLYYNEPSVCHSEKETE